MTDRKADRVVSIALSILIHLAIVGALVWGWFHYRQPEPTPQSLAIEGTVVPNATPPQAQPAPPKHAEPPPPTPQPPPEEDAQRKKAEEQKAADAAAEQQRQADKAVADKAAADKAAADRAAADRAAADKAVTEKAAAEKAAADRVAADKAEADRKAEAARQKAEAEKKAQELAQQKRAEEERTQRETDLRAQLAAEEHLNAVQSSPAKAEYLSLITARINHAWIRPPSARAGVKCSVHITQVPGGVITHVTVTGCNGDESVRQSVETAAYRASPLPAPSDPALFDPNIDVTFAPDE
jgi:colicin import membrane protein